MAKPQEEKARITFRLTFAFSEEAMNRLNTLKELAGITDDAELIRNALQAYGYLVSETRDGTEFYRRPFGGEMAPFKFLEIVKEPELGGKDPSA